MIIYFFWSSSNCVKFNNWLFLFEFISGSFKKNKVRGWPGPSSDGNNSFIFWVLISSNSGLGGYKSSSGDCSRFTNKFLGFVLFKVLVLFLLKVFVILMLFFESLFFVLFVLLVLFISFMLFISTDSFVLYILFLLLILFS